MKGKRYYLIDILRSISIINMVFYHGMWDLVYIFGIDIGWYKTPVAYVWQQYICWTFILISGFCQPLSHRSLKKAMIVFGGGMLFTLVTVTTMPQNRVVFGILTLIGSCMLISIPLDKILKKLNPKIGIAVTMILFFITRNVPRGYLGFEKIKFLKLPDSLYNNLLTAYLGFPNDEFYSTDYFPLIPWVFLFFTGYFLYKVMEDKKILHYLKGANIKPLIWIGQHSLIIYVLHQPILYLIFLIAFM